MFETAQAAAVTLASFAMLAIPALGLLIVSVAGLYFGFTRPYLVVLCYLIPFFFFSMTTYGALEGGRTIWGRGSGLLYLPAVTWGVLAIYTLTVFSNSYNRKVVSSTAMHPWFIAWGILLIGHLMAALFLGETLAQAGHAFGFRNIVLAGILFALLLRAFDTPKTIDYLVRFMLVCVIARGLYGVARFLFQGGDPSNVYANFGGANVKLTFFDINDSLLATIVLFICVWSLISRWRELDIWKRMMFLSASAIELFIVVFSYRRTAWGGLLLACHLLVWLLPARKRIVAALIGMPVAITGVAYVASKRLGNSPDGFINKFVGEFSGGGVGGISQREYELRLAWQTFFDNPIFGVGSWGTYHKGFALIDWQQGENAFGFLHSGILHILVKSGLLGFALIAGLMIAFLNFVIRHREQVSPERHGLYYAGLAGFLFLLPTWFLGTPVPEYRTTQMFAFCLALPVLAYRASTSAASKQ